MLKFLAILFIVCYVTFKLGGFLMKVLQAASGKDPKQQNFKNRKKADGNVNVDYVPDDKKTGKSGYQGGEYVDYEELK